MSGNTDTTLVSVIINVRNGERYILEALQSACRQTYKQIEIIVWDNNSCDETQTIVEHAEKNDGRIKYMRSDISTSLGEARNLALEVANGEFIAFLDSDDIWLPTKLESQLPLFHDPDVALVYSDTILFNDNGVEEFFFAKKTPVRGAVFEDILLRYPISMESVILRSSVLTQLTTCFDARFSYIEEYELFCRIAAHWKVDFVGDALSKWRVHSNSLTWLNKSEFVREKYLMLEDMNKLADQPDSKYNHQLLQKFKDEILREAARVKWAEGSGKKARDELSKISVKYLVDFLLYMATFFSFNLIFSLYGLVRRQVRP